MLKESEQRLGGRMKEIKELEAKEGPTGQKKKEEAEVSRFKNSPPCTKI
jgi:hypothetical protein